MTVLRSQIIGSVDETRATKVRMKARERRSVGYIKLDRMGMAQLSAILYLCDNEQMA